MKFGMRLCAPGKRATLLTVRVCQTSSRNPCLPSDISRTPLLPGAGALRVVNLLSHLLPCLARFVHRDFILDGTDIARVMIQDHRLKHTTHDLDAARLGKHADKVTIADDGQCGSITEYGVEQDLH